MSPLRLLQEQLAATPWRMLVACLLLNRTRGTQVRRVVWALLRAWGGPGGLVGVSDAWLEAILRPLGLWRRRACLLRRFDRALAEGVPLGNLPGVGAYARDSLRIFVDGDIDVEPTDGLLAAYVRWRRDGHTGDAGEAAPAAGVYGLPVRHG